MTTTKTENEKCLKLNLSFEPSKKFIAMLLEVNSNMTYGQVTKQDLANWIITNFHDHHFKNQKDAIQKAFFDEKIYLKTLLKKKQDLPQEIKDIIKISVSEETKRGA